MGGSARESLRSWFGVAFRGNPAFRTGDSYNSFNSLRRFRVTDVFDRAKRSQVMSRIKNKGTSVEETLYSLIRKSLGPKWRVDRNVGFLPGRPDILIPSLRIAIFAHGCFYHSCVKHGHIPKSNREYWAPKLEGNSQRDRRNRRRLRALGFSVWTIWEHDLEGSRIQRTYSKVRRRLDKARSTKRCLAA